MCNHLLSKILLQYVLSWIDHIISSGDRKVIENYIKTGGQLIDEALKTIK